MPDAGVAPRGSVIVAAREQLTISLEQVWLAYVAVGGNRPLRVLRTWFEQSAHLSDREYDLVAQALNDHFVERGLNHPVAYSDGS